jgi:hypothetical protein
MGPYTISKETGAGLETADTLLLKQGWPHSCTQARGPPVLGCHVVRLLFILSHLLWTFCCAVSGLTRADGRWILLSL